MGRAKFDKLYKNLIMELGEQLNIPQKSPYPLDPQVLVETVTGYQGDVKS